MFERGMDGREIAKKLRFTSYKDMADFMKSKGYIWNEGKSNYELQPQEIKEYIKPPEKDIEQTMGTVVTNTDIGQYEDLFKLLDANRDRLAELLQGDCGKSDTKAITVPRYVLAGVTINKGIKINVGLDKLVKDFSLERSVSQKDIIEVALIDFLKKHGYSDDVKAVLKV